MRALAGTADITDLDLSGFNPDASRMLRSIREAIGPDVRGAIILDRDYRADEEVAAITSRLRKQFELVHVFERKEIENYLLDPVVLQEVVDIELKEQAAHSKKRLFTFDAVDVLSSIVESKRQPTQAQILTKARAFDRSRRQGVDESSIDTRSINRFETQWSTLEGKLALVSGKDVIAPVNRHLEPAGVSVSVSRLVVGFETASRTHRARQPT